MFALFYRLQILADRIYPESVWLPLHKVNCWLDILSPSTARKVQRTEPTTLSCLHRPDQGIRPCKYRDGVFKVLPLIGCPPRLLSIVRSFHDGMMGTVQLDDDLSAEFGVKSGVKQGCVIVPTLFGIFFALLLKHAFKSCTGGVYLFSRSDGHLLDISRYQAKNKIR